MATAAMGPVLFPVGSEGPASVRPRANREGDEGFAGALAAALAGPRGSAGGAEGDPAGLLPGREAVGAAGTGPEEPDRKPDGAVGGPGTEPLGTGSTLAAAAAGMMAPEFLALLAAGVPHGEPGIGATGESLTGMAAGPAIGGGFAGPGIPGLSGTWPAAGGAPGQAGAVGDRAVPDGSQQAPLPGSDTAVAGAAARTSPACTAPEAGPGAGSPSVQAGAPAGTGASGGTGVLPGPVPGLAASAIAGAEAAGVRGGTGPLPGDPAGAAAEAAGEVPPVRTAGLPGTAGASAPTGLAADGSAGGPVDRVAGPGGIRGTARREMQAPETLAPGMVQDPAASGASQDSSPATAHSPGQAHGAAWGPELLEQVARALERARLRFSRSGEAEVRVRLHPPELGEIRLRLTLRDGQIHGQLLAGRPEVKEALEAQKAEIWTRLQEQGLQVGGFDVSLAGDGSARQGEPRAGRPMGHRRQAGAGEAEAGAPPAADAPRGLTPGIWPGVRRIDLRA